MVIKLNKSIREAIVKSACAGLFVDEFAYLDAREKYFGDRFFSKHIATPEQYEVMRKLPAEFFFSSESFNAYISERYRNIRMSGLKRMPACASLYSNQRITDDEAVKQLDTFAKERESLLAQKRELEVKIRQVVMSATTVEKLLTIWPEAKKFIPASVYDTGAANLPAVLVEDLNLVLMNAGVKFEESHV